MRLNFKYSHHVMTNLVISVVFFIMVAVFLISLSQYWSNILDPRLSLAAKTQAEILSQSQSGTLLKALETKEEGRRRKEEERRRKEEGGRRKEEAGRRKEEAGRKKEEGRTWNEEEEGGRKQEEADFVFHCYAKCIFK